MRLILGPACIMRDVLPLRLRARGEAIHRTLRQADLWQGFVLDGVMVGRQHLVLGTVGLLRIVGQLKLRNLHMPICREFN